MSVYQLYGSGAASADGVASLDIQFDGDIVAWHASAQQSAADALSDGYAWQASFISTSMFASNDARGVIGNVNSRLGLLTSGGGNMATNTGMSGLNVPVVAGERIYLHLSVLGGGSSACTWLLYVLDSADVNIRRRR